MKVIEKIKAAEADNETLFSFEFYVPKSEDGVEILSKCIERLVAHGPSFCDITWRAEGDLTLEIANVMQNIACVETMMHLTCTNLPVQKIDHALSTIKANGLKNVLALRGDPPHGHQKFVPLEGGFACALDLVVYIKRKYGDHFGITVAGYPEAHPDVIGANSLVSPEAYASDLAYLKQKVDAGADLIITQLFYDADVFLKFVNDCRKIGITCPIVPGIMPILSYRRFLGATRLCKTMVPQEITDALEPIKDNEEAVRAYGIHLGTEMCKKILASGIKCLHFYTMNVDKSAIRILMNLGLIEESRIQRPINVDHIEEDARPVCRDSKSYITQTNGQDQYLHGQSGGDHLSVRSHENDKKLHEVSLVPLQSNEAMHEMFKSVCLGKLRKQSLVK